MCDYSCEPCGAVNYGESTQILSSGYHGRRSRYCKQKTIEFPTGHAVGRNLANMSFWQRSCGNVTLFWLVKKKTVPGASQDCTAVIFMVTCPRTWNVRAVRCFLHLSWIPDFQISPTMFPFLPWYFFNPCERRSLPSKEYPLPRLAHLRSPLLRSLLGRSSWSPYSWPPPTFHFPSLFFSFAPSLSSCFNIIPCTSLSLPQHAGRA